MSQIRRYANAHGMTELEVRATVERVMKELVANTPISRREDYAVLQKILRSGRIKSQFETGTSGGALAPDVRRPAEFKGLGFPLNTIDKERPIYGFFNLNPGDDAAWWYGGLEFVFKDEVRNRATFTIGDSLGLFLIDTAYGSPVNAPKLGSADTAVAAIMEYALTGDLDDFLGKIVLNYVEVQVQGGVQLSDISHIVDNNRQLTSADRDQLRRLGIGVR
jgi:hypothetical protein